MRRDFSEEVSDFVRGVAACSVSIGHDRELAIRAECGEVARSIQSVRFQIRVTYQDGLVRTRAAVSDLNDDALGGAVRGRVGQRSDQFRLDRRG